MAENLEWKVSPAKAKQRTGVFKLPQRVKNRRVVRYWLESLNGMKVPLVIPEEHYSRRSIMNKLGPERNLSANRNLVIALMNYGLIRARNRNKTIAHSKPVDSLSLQQTISGFFGVPIEETKVSQEYLQSKEFRNRGFYARIPIQCNAYAGTRWFETFKSKIRKRANEIKIYPSQKIRLKDLNAVLKLGRYRPNEPGNHIVRLVNEEMIVPEEKRFKRKGTTNYVDVKRLSKLLSIVTGKHPHYFRHPDDSYFDKLVESYIQNKLLPYLVDKDLSAEKRYSVREAAKLIGVKPDIFRMKVKNKVIKNTTYDASRTSVLGIDIATHVLKRTREKRFNRESLGNLFDVRDLDLDKLGIYPNPNRVIDRHSYAFPLYDRIATQARETVLKNPYLIFSYRTKTNPTQSFSGIVSKSILQQRQLDART